MSKIDFAGRVVIPKHIREKYDLQPGTQIEFVEFVPDGSGVRILRKIAACSLCGSEEKLLKNGSCYLCRDCLSAFQKE